MSERIKLGEICNILNGYAFKSKKYVDKGIRVIRITNVQKGDIEDLEPKYYDVSEIDKLQNYMLKENDLLISLTGNVGRVALMSKKFLPAGLNQRVGCLRIKDEKNVSIRYLYQYLNNNRFETECINNSNGIAQKNLSTEWLKDYNIFIPDINVQNKIADELEKIQEIIKIKKKQIKEFNELIKSQFVEMFGCKQDGFKCPTIQFSECVSNMLKGPFGSDIKKSLYVPKAEDTYKVYIQVNAIQKDENLGDYYISKEYFDSKMYKFEVKPLDYIVTCDGTLGKLLRLDDNMEKGIISASLLKITLNEKISYKYFEEVWNQYMLGELSKDIRNACLTHLPSAKVIGSLHIPLPSKELQDKYTKIVEQIDKQKFEIKKSLKEMQELYESLMEKYFG